MAEEKIVKPDLTPGMARIKGAGIGAVAGLAGGLAVVIGVKLLGPQLGPILGGTLAGALIGGDAGKIIAVNAAMDTMILTAAGLDNG